MTHSDPKTAFKDRNGLAMIVAMILMTAALGASLSIAELFLREFRINSDIKFSVQAFYAAETGIENSLKTEEVSFGILANGASYSVVKLDSGESGCLGDNYCLISVGAFEGTKRAIQVSR